MLVKSYLAVVAAVVLAVSSISQGAPPLNDSPSPIVVAHRGLILDAPENTLASFKACLELGFGFELDVQRTRCLLYTSPSPRDAHESRMPSSA